VSEPAGAPPAYVLDASALLALLHAEPGAEAVGKLVACSAISAVNWCEVFGKLRAVGVDGDALAEGVAETGIEIVAFDEDQARLAGELHRSTKDAGLSLADRACLALATHLGVPAVTADKAWTSLDVRVEVRCIR
jgi:PIN domain nuclease of toxin-antitoxin system